MSACNTNYEAPGATTRNDSFACSVVLAAMLVSALSGAFVADVDATEGLAGKPAPYSAVEEA
jgi:hypothetical protein